MARSHARFELALFSPDRDPDLAALSKDAKLLYVVIVTDPALNHAGVVLLRTGVWAEEASLDDDEFDLAFVELEETRFTVVDQRTSELLVRSFIRSDKVSEQPNVLKGALSQAQQTRSRVIRRALAAELWRLPPRPADRVGKNGRPISYPDPHACAALLDPDGGPGTPNPSSNPSQNPSPNPSGNPSNGTLPGTLPRRDAGRAGGRGRGSTSTTGSSQETSGKHTQRAAREPEGFAEFWALYPRKEGKRAAEKAYAAALKRDVPVPRLLEAVKRYAALTAHTEARFIAHPSTWLNQGRYDDEPTLPSTALVVGHDAPRIATTTARFRAAQALKRPEPGGQP